MNEEEQKELEELQRNLNAMYVNNNQIRSILGNLPSLERARLIIVDMRMHLARLGIEADW